MSKQLQKTVKIPVRRISEYYPWTNDRGAPHLCAGFSYHHLAVPAKIKRALLYFEFCKEGDIEIRTDPNYILQWRFVGSPVWDSTYYSLELALRVMGVLKQRDRQRLNLYIEYEV